MAHIIHKVAPRNTLCYGQCIHIHGSKYKKFEQMLTRRAKAYISSISVVS